MTKKRFVMLIAVLVLSICLTMAFGITAYADGEETVGETVAASEIQEAAAPADNAEQTTPASDATSEIIPEEVLPVGQDGNSESGTVEDESLNQPEIVEPAQEPEVTVEEEPVSQESENPAEKSANPVITADFTGKDGAKCSLELGGSVDLGELIANLGYEGEIDFNSFVSSKPEALDVNEEGKLVFKQAFGDETIKIMVGGAEIEIPVHDPAYVAKIGDKSYESVAAAFEEAQQDDTVQLIADIDISTTLAVVNGKNFTLDLSGHVLRMTGVGSVIKINSGGILTIIDNAPTVVHEGYVDSNGLWHLGTGEGTQKSISGGIITGGTGTQGDYAICGGGVYVDGGTFNMTGGSITGNTAYDGGGVYVYNGSFTMNGGTISGNTVNYSGGGVYVYDPEPYDGSFIMNGGEISGNTAFMGGGVRSDGKAIMNGGTISGNTANYSGGGVYVDDYSCMTINGGTISGNTATERGGGVYLDNYGYLTVGGDGKITGNTLANGTTASNLYLYGNKVSIGEDGQAPKDGMLIGVTLREGTNVTKDGDTGVYAKYFTSDDSGKIPVNKDGIVQLVELENGTVAVNVDTNAQYTSVQNAVTAAGERNTIKMVKDSTEDISVLGTDDEHKKVVTLDLNGHVLKGTGGDNSVISVDSYGELTLKDSNPTATHTGDYAGLPAGGVITGGNASVGGGVCVNENGSFTMKGGSITDNTATNGSGVYVYPDASFTMEGGSISDNTATNGGGVLNRGIFIMHDGEISGNSATQIGGGVYTVGSESIFFMNGGSITKNEAKYGGGVCVYDNASFTMNGGSITDNKAIEDGGGVYDFGRFTMNQNATISKNSAKRGGGVFVDEGIFFALVGGTIDQNEAQNGGGVYVAKNGRLEAVNGTISNCVATENGGGIYVVNGGTATLNSPDSKTTSENGSSVTGCSAVNGGAIYSEGAIGLEVASITGNTATGNGGGICLGTGGSIFLGSTAKVTDNTVASEANNLYISDDVLLVKIGSGKDVKIPQEGMKIGVTTESVPAVGAPVDITTENDEDCTKYFTSDNTSYTIVNGEGNKVQLSVPEEPKPIPTPGAAIEKVNVYVDGKLLTEGTDYNWFNGKVQFTDEFLNTLEEGEHTLKVDYSGSVVEETFSFTNGTVVPGKENSLLKV